MESIYNFILENQNKAPWILFFLYLLAGMSFPISIDILIIISALIASMAPEMFWPLFICSFLGCYFSAWIAYWLGRGFGRKLLKYNWMKKLLPENRLTKMRNFYARKGFLTLLLGRFIPFGVRNAIFMSTGISKASFTKFALKDLFPSIFWTSTTFLTFYYLGSNFESLSKLVKTVHLSLFYALSVTVIIFFWYKWRKKRRQRKARSRQV